MSSQSGPLTSLEWKLFGTSGSRPEQRPIPRTLSRALVADNRPGRKRIKHPVTGAAVHEQAAGFSAAARQSARICLHAAGALVRDMRGTSAVPATKTVASTLVRYSALAGAVMVCKTVGPSPTRVAAAALDLSLSPIPASARLRRGGLSAVGIVVSA